jgi:uncharacterized protein YjbI with pentapeptide repeats
LRIFSGIFADFSSKVYEFYQISFKEKFHNFRSLSFRSLSRQEFVSSGVCLSGVCLSGVCLSGVCLSGVCHGTCYLSLKIISPLPKHLLLGKLPFQIQDEREL